MDNRKVDPTTAEVKRQPIQIVFSANLSSFFYRLPWGQIPRRKPRIVRKVAA